MVDNIGGKLSSNGIYYTDSEGQINISGVTGTLVFTEISSIPGYLIDENRKSQTTLTVAVSGNAANGYQLTNRADAGGKYQGTWQTAQGTWVTVIRRLTPTVTPKLPKTGY